MVIGGTQVFADALAHARFIYKTEVHGSPAGRAYFPAIDWDAWKEVSREALAARSARTTSQPSSWCWSANKQRAAARLRLKRGGQQPILEARLRSRDALSYKASRSIPAEETGFLWSPARAKGAARPLAQSRPALKQ